MRAGGTEGARMITAETLPGIVLGLLVVVVGTVLGVRSALRKRDEEDE